MRIMPLTFLAALLSLPLGAAAASIGDPAPKLFVEQWVKGGATHIAPGTNIYVVEFWATWCPPCRESIPRLTEMQKKYGPRGVIIAGISSEAAAKVVPFVTEKGQEMNYRVGVDSSQKTSDAWMRAYGETGIPHAFVVDRTGNVAWHGFPNSRLDRVLQQMIDGKYDIDAAKKIERGERMVKEYVKMVKVAKAEAKAAPVGEKILAEYSLVWTTPYELSEAILTDPAVRSRDLPLALKAANKAVEMTGGRSSDALEMQARGLFASGKKQEAVEAQKKAIAVCTDSSDQQRLNKFLALYEKGSQTPAKK